MFLTAKPVSIRRLSVFFTFALLFTRAVLALSYVGNAPRASVTIAMTLTICVWGMPLIRFVVQTFVRGAPAWHAFGSASEMVKCTYGFALAMAALLVVKGTLLPAHVFTFSALLRTTVLALFAAIALSAFIRVQKGHKGRWAQFG